MPIRQSANGLVRTTVLLVFHKSFHQSDCDGHFVANLLNVAVCNDVIYADNVDLAVVFERLSYMAAISSDASVRPAALLRKLALSGQTFSSHLVANPPELAYNDGIDQTGELIELARR